MTAIVAACAVLLLLWTASLFRSPARRAQGAFAIIVLLLYLSLLHFAFRFPSLSNNLSKGGAQDASGPLVLALFSFMLFGMLVEYLVQYLNAKPRKRQFDWGSFFTPILISPMVFMPLVASLQNVNVELSHFSIPLLMLFLVAFENGFLWRGYFARKLAQSQKG
ncbi:MAG TPA: hypothetical protein VH325_11550 [Bryobacteraceae bacterium]|jgi:hypothetical protein|nr:hypothetical protein [Bryobacteraceae bacterium]